MPEMTNEITYADAIDIVKKGLREDEGLYFAYQANIAMSFIDELARNGIDFPNRHEIANQAAKNFLNLLITESSPGE